MEETTARGGPEISGVVLAGGKSARLGTDKAFLALDGQPLVARTVQTLAALCQDLVVVTNSPARYEGLRLPARLVPDERPGEGSLMGLYSGLNAARHPYAIVVACDMPFLRLSLLRYMVGLAPGHDLVIPDVGGYLEPLHAVYGRTCLPHIADLLDHEQRKIIAFFERVRVRYVREREIDDLDPLRLSFVNVNTPEEWQRVQVVWAQYS